jgi:hypothetical protein
MAFYQVLSPDEKYIVFQTKAESEELALGQALERWPGDCGRIERVTTAQALASVLDVACEEILDAVIEGMCRLEQEVAVAATYAELKAAVDAFLAGS